MSWPLSQDYNEAVQSPAAAFTDPELRAGQVQVNALGLPLPRSGNFADVYQIQCPTAAWAVKCFTRQVAGQSERYAAISQYLQQAKLPFTVDFQYLEQGIRVHKQWYPVLKMRWVEGLLLNAFVRDAIDKPALLYQLAQIWLRMARRLREAKVAHADLQHGNVLLVPGSKTQSLAVKLIDYDGMWVPALAGQKSGEVGHPNYQHPQRLREGIYSPEVDRFPELVVATALRALALGGRPLWERHDNGDNLLFKEPDLREPAKSALFAELRGMNDALLQTLVGKLEAAVQGKLEETPLLEELLADEKRLAKSKAVAAAAAPGMDWSFTTDEDRPRLPRRKRGGVSGWAWGAAAAVLVSLTAALGGVYLANHGGESKPQPVAQSQTPPEAPPETPASAKAAPRGSTEKKPEEPKTDPKKQPGDPKSSGPDKQPSDPVVSPPDKRPMDPPPEEPPPLVGRPVGVLQVLPGTPNLLIDADAKGKKWGLSELDDFGVWKPRQQFVGHAGAVTCVALAPEPGLALSGSEDRTVRLWDVKTGESLRTFSGHAHRVVAVAISPDGKRGLSADLGRKVRLWDLEAGKEVRSLDHPGGVASVAFSPDGKRIVCGLGHARAGENCTLHLWSARSGSPLGRLAGHPQAVLGVTFAPEGDEVASGGADGSVRLWKEGREARSFAGKAPVHQVAYAPGGRILLGTAGGVTHFWNLVTDRSILKEVPGSEVAAAGFAPDGRALWVGREGGGRLSTRLVTDPEKLTAVVVPRPSPPPVPAKEALAQAEKQLRELLKDDKPAARKKKLRELAGQETETPALRYAALKRLLDEEAEAGNIAEALKHAETLSERFQVGRLAAGSEVVQVAAKAVRAKPQQQAIVEQALKLVTQAEGEDDYDLALKLLAVAEVAAGKAGKSELPLVVAIRERELAEVRSEFGPVKKALAILAQDANDPEANLTVGRFRVTFQDAWEEGLTLLSRGSDDTLERLAKKDLEDPADDMARKELGDGWVKAAEKEKGKPAAQRAFWRRAYHWYKLAQAGLPELALAEVKKRMGQIARQVEAVADPWRHVDRSEAKLSTDFLSVEGGKCLFTRRWYRGGVDVTVVARTTKDNIRLTAGPGGRVIFNYEAGGMYLDHADNSALNGRGQDGDSPGNADSNPRRLKENKWYELRWQLTPGGSRVWVDGELVLQAEKAYDLSVPRPVGVCSFDSAIEVKSLVVKPVLDTPPTP